MKTSELTGQALDWAVAKCEGDVTELMYDGITWGFKLDGKIKVLAKGWAISMMWNPSTDWALGGPIIERENIGLVCQQIGSTQGCAYRHTENGEVFYYYGPTPLIAAMRCYVASKLGDEVEIPKELT
jgi:hypothetical protein